MILIAGDVSDGELDRLASLIEQDQNENAQVSGKENQLANKAVVTNKTNISTVEAKSTNDANSARRLYQKFLPEKHLGFKTMNFLFVVLSMALDLGRIA